MPTKMEKDWLEGRTSLGATTRWTVEEMRLIAELGFWLAQEGRNKESITIFEGLAALAPVTSYFQSALGALKLRIGELEEALDHLNKAILADPQDSLALANRGEVNLQLGNFEEAVNDFQNAQKIVKESSSSSKHLPLHIVRASALLARLRRTLATAADPFALFPAHSAELT